METKKRREGKQEEKVAQSDFETDYNWLLGIASIVLIYFFASLC